MIVDAHGHLTLPPPAHTRFRERQLAWLAEPAGPPPEPEPVADEELRATVAGNQIRVMDERGIDLMLLSPQASAMGHHVADPGVAADWARACNDLTARVAGLFPGRFALGAQLPQVAGEGLGPAVAELRRCVSELGFVGCNLNPDPSGGRWTAPPLTDPYWFPLFEALVELDVPAMIHVSTSCTPAVHTLGAHYLAADTAVFMQLLEGDLFGRFPTLRLVVPHGGGAVPYHWGRYRGLAVRLGRPDPVELLRNVSFDTCVYHQPGMELLHRVVGTSAMLFATEPLGAVRGADPVTGIEWDDTRRYVEHLDLGPDERYALFEGNARRVYPRLDRVLTLAKGLT